MKKKYSTVKEIYFLNIGLTLVNRYFHLIEVATEMKNFQMKKKKEEVKKGIYNSY